MIIGLVIFIFLLYSLINLTSDNNIKQFKSKETMLYYGTHNSCTYGKLVWWQWLFTPIFQLFSKCQDKNLEEQIKMGVKVFNFQVTWYKGDWYFSHGLCTYREKLRDALELMNQFATEEDPLYFQLYLDKNFFLGQNKDEFRDLLENELSLTCSPGRTVILLGAWIEGTTEYPYKSGVKINLKEHYWTSGWAEKYGKSWIDKLPLPKRHAEKYNSEYKKKYKNPESDTYLMLDYFEID